MIDFGSNPSLYINALETPAFNNDGATDYGLVLTGTATIYGANNHLLVGFDLLQGATAGSTTGFSAEGMHAGIRFNVGTVIGGENFTIVGTSIVFQVDTTNSSNTIGVDLWASEFGQNGFTAAQYNQPTNNLTSGNLGVVGTLRARLTQLVIPGAVTEGTVVSCPVPSRFLPHNPTGISGGFADFELRPSLVNGAYPAIAGTDHVSFYGTNTVYGPYVSGYAFTDAELQTTDLPTLLPYRFQGVGAETYVAFGIEANRGQAVMGRYLLDVNSSTLDSYAQTLMSSSLNKNRIRPRKMAVGRAGAGGTITFELTPDRWTRLFMGLMQVTSSVGIPAAPTATYDAVSGLLGLGVYEYMVVFAQDTTPAATNLDGCPGAAASVTTSLASKKVNLTNIPVSTSSLVVSRKVYRTVVGGSQFYLLAVIDDNTTTSYLDNIADSVLLTQAPLPVYGQNFNRIYFGPATSNQINTFTFIQKTGFMRSVYPGCMLSSLRLTLDMDRITTAVVDLDALAEVEYDDTAAGEANDIFILEGGAAYDSVANGLLSYTGSEVTIGGVTTGDLVQNFEITFAQSTAQRRGLNRKRGPTSHYALGFVITARFTLYFDNEYILRRAMGNTGHSFPFQAGYSLILDQLQVYYAGQIDGDPTTNQMPCQRLTITLPSMSYETITKPVQGEAAIMLDCSGVAAFNDSLGTNFQMELLTNESPSDFAVSSNPITVLPPGIAPFVSVPTTI